MLLPVEWAAPCKSRSKPAADELPTCARDGPRSETMTVHHHADAFDQPLTTTSAADPATPRAPRWMVERYGIGAGTTTVDLGAGTGKLTRVLVEGRVG